MKNIFDILSKNNWQKHIVENNNFEKIIGLYNFPDDYLGFIKQCWGEGYIGKNYLSIWKPEWVEQLNIDYQIQKYLGFNCYGFGTDGGDYCYLFDNKNGPKIIISELGDLNYKDVKIISGTFFELIEKMDKKYIEY